MPMKYSIPSFDIEPDGRLTIRLKVDDGERLTWLVRLEVNGVVVHGAITGEILTDAVAPMEPVFLDELRKRISVFDGKANAS